MVPVPDFDDVIGAARGGDEWVVAVLYRDLHPRLLGYLRAREPRAAEHLEAETWLAIAQRITAFEGDQDAFRGWVFSIARRRLADYRRTAARRATYPTPTTELDRPDQQNVEDVALDGLSTDTAAAFVVDADRGNSGNSIAFSNLRNAANDAGTSVKDYCKDATTDAVDTELTSPVSTPISGGIGTGSSASNGTNTVGVDHAAPAASKGSANANGHHDRQTPPRT